MSFFISHKFIIIPPTEEKCEKGNQKEQGAQGQPNQTLQQTIKSSGETRKTQQVKAVFW